MMGLTFAITQLEGNNGNKCSCVFENKLRADCNCVNIVSLPDNLDENIQNLTMRIFSTTEKVLQFNKDHLKKFVHLKTFVLQAIQVTELKISRDLLEPLHDLRILNISFLQVDPPEIPSSVTILIANSIGNKSHPDMSKLEKLEILVFESNFMENLPSLPDMAPLQEIDLSGNPLRELTYHNLAPYCQLRKLILKGSLVELDTLKCCGIKTWAEDTQITSDVHCGIEDKNCHDKIEQHDYSADDVYVTCMTRIGQVEIAPEAELSFQIILSLSLIITIGYLFYRYYSSDAMKMYRESKKPESVPKLKYFMEEEEDQEEDIKL